MSIFIVDLHQSIGKGMEVPIGAFLSAWQPNNYELTIVSKKTPPTEV